MNMTRLDNGKTLSRTQKQLFQRLLGTRKFNAGHYAIRYLEY